MFALYADKTLVFLGSALGPNETIRSRLREHLGKGDALASAGATRYKREASEDPATRLESLLTEFRGEHGGNLPKGNAAT